MKIKDKKPVRLAYVGFRVLPEQRARLEEIARERGTTVSDLLRPMAESLIAS